MRISKTVHNTPLRTWEAVRILANVDAITGLRLATMYGHLEGISGGGFTVFKQAGYARRSGLNRKTVHADLKKLAELNWIEVTTDYTGTEIRCLKIPGLSEEGCPSDGQGCPSDTQGGCPSTGQGVAHPLGRGLPAQGAGVARPLGNTKELSKNFNKNLLKKVDQNPTDKKSSKNSTSKKKSTELTKAQLSLLIEVWNNSKPSTFATHRSLPPLIQKAMLRHIRSVGLSFDEFIDRLPLVLRAAKRHAFFSKKRENGDLWTWANFVGGSSGFKDRFCIELEKVDTKTNNLDTTAMLSTTPAEHPLFQPPSTPIDRELIPRANTNPTSAQRADAEKFYEAWPFPGLKYYRDGRKTIYVNGYGPND